MPGEVWHTSRQTIDAVWLKIARNMQSCGPVLNLMFVVAKQGVPNIGITNGFNSCSIMHRFAPNNMQLGNAKVTKYLTERPKFSFVFYFNNRTIHAIGEGANGLTKVPIRFLRFDWPNNKKNNLRKSTAPSFVDSRFSCLACGYAIISSISAVLFSDFSGQAKAEW